MQIIALGIAGWLFGVGFGEVRRFERGAAAEIGSQLAGAEKRVAVQIRPAGLSGALASATIRASAFQTEGLPLFTEPDRSTRGILHELRLDLRNFRVRGFRVAALTAKIPGCRFDYSEAVRRGKIRLSRCGEGAGQVRLEDPDLGAFVMRKFPEIKEVTVKVREGGVTVDGFGDFLVVQSRFHVEAKLQIVGGRKLMLTNAVIRFDEAGVDGAARDVLLAALNPVVDLDRDLGLAGAIDIQEIQLSNGVIVASGACRIPVRPT